MFASYLSRLKSHPILKITSANCTPEWVSDSEAQMLAVGTCDFTCCQRNHIFGDKIVPCDRDITREILLKLIEAKIKRILDQRSFTDARLTMVCPLSLSLCFSLCANPNMNHFKNTRSAHHIGGFEPI